MLWDYKDGRSQPPLVAQWGGTSRTAELKDAQPRMLSALAFLHASYGRLPWSKVLQPAIDLATNGTPINSELAASSHFDPEQPLGELIENRILTMPRLATFLGKLQQNTSHQLAKAWSSSVNITNAQTIHLGRWILQLPNNQSAANATLEALLPLFENGENFSIQSPDELTIKLARSMKQLQMESKWPATGIATGIAVIDTRDVYVSLVMGLSGWLGTKQLTAEGWLRDDTGSSPPPPAILADGQTCGQRYVAGAGDTAALVQVLGALALTKANLSTAVELQRILPLPKGGLGLEFRTTSTSPTLLVTLNAQGVAQNISEPYPSVNVVQKTGDVLSSHADSRGGGHASRF